VWVAEEVLLDLVPHMSTKKKWKVSVLRVPGSSWRRREKAGCKSFLGIYL